MATKISTIDMPDVLEKATAHLERTMPDPIYRKSVLQIFSRAIHVMQSQNPNCWSINYHQNVFWLLIEHEYALACVMASKELEFHVYLKQLAKNTLLRLENEAKVKVDKSDLWSLITIRMPEQEQLIDLIWPAFKAYIDDKARHDLHPASIPPHLRKGAGIVEYIRVNNIDPNLPQPGYVHNPPARMGERSIPHEMNIGNRIRLGDLVNSFAAANLSFTPWEVATFYTALQTKGFVILSGISGMGKTKLAQAFARLLPQPKSRVIIPEDLIRIVVQPYMLKYSRIIIPKSSIEFFTPPEAGQSFQVNVVFGEQSEICMLKHYRYSNTDYIQIYLKSKSNNWFMKNFPANETIILEPKLDEDDKIIEFRLGKLEDYSKTVQIDPQDNPDNYLFLSVRPDWRDSKSLLGYFNPIDQQYHSTPFLEFIKKAHDSYKQNENLAWFVVLDEMNLARVEYYFSDLLSVLESGRDSKGWSREPIRLDYPFGLEISEYEREIYLPPNLYFIGTVNVDETTHAFSPKVLDRAFTMELTEADFSNYPFHYNTQFTGFDPLKSENLLIDFTRNGKYAQIEKSEIFAHLDSEQNLRQELSELNNLLKPYDLHFGYRVLDEITAFLVNADQSGFFEDMEFEADPLDAAILMKVLPKFHGSRAKLEQPLKKVLAWCQDPLTSDGEQIENIIQNSSSSVDSLIQSLKNITYQYPRTADRVIRMIRSLYTTGFASFG